MKKRPIDDKQLLKSSAQLAEIFCFYPFTVENEILKKAQETFTVYEVGIERRIFKKHTPLCIEAFHETLLALAEGGDSLLDEIHVIKEVGGKIKRAKVPRTDLGKDPKIQFALTFNEAIQSQKQLNDEVIQLAIYAIVHFWSESLRATYVQISPEAKKHIKAS